MNEPNSQFVSSCLHLVLRHAFSSHKVSNLSLCNILFYFLQWLRQIQRFIVELPLNYSKAWNLDEFKLNKIYTLISTHFSSDFCFYAKLKEKTAILIILKTRTICIFLFKNNFKYNKREKNCFALGRFLLV